MVRRTCKRQRGGSHYTGGYSNYAFTGPAAISAGGVPFESRGATNDNCGWNYRAAPQLGGRRSRSRQQGGGCGCTGGLQFGGRSRKLRRQLGGGGGTGGYSFDFGNNALGKVYAALPVGPCPAAPVANQLGGASDHELLGIDSYKTGYGFDSRGVVSTSSAHYLDPSGYDRTCKGGARRRKRTLRARG